MRCEKCGNEIPSFAVYCPYCGEHVEDAVEPTDYEYEAFVSYRHRPADRAAATRIQHQLEGANIPKDLRNPPEKKRMGRLFRDEDELIATASLSDTIVEALRRSRYLILICTPDTRTSQWVLREVETFAALHGRDRILTALAAGEPSESFPPLLLSRWVPDEETGAYHEVPSEPLAANLRPENKRNHSREIVRLQASILGCGYDDLQQRIRMRRMRMNVAIAVALMLAGLAFGVFALAQKAETQMAYLVALRNESEMLARESQIYLDSGKRIEALRSACNALPDKDNDRPLVPEAQLALERALGIFPKTTPWVAYSIDGISQVYDSCDELQATVENGSTIVLSDIDTGARMRTIEAPAQDTDAEEDFAEQIVLGLKFGDGTLVCRRRQSTSCLDVNTGKQLWSVEGTSLLENLTSILYLKSSRQFVIPSAVISNGAYMLAFEFYDEKTGQLVRTVKIEDAPKGSYPRFVTSSSDERYIAAILESYGDSDAEGSTGIALFASDADVDGTSKVLTALCSRKHAKDIAFVNETIVVVGMNDPEYPDKNLIDGIPTVDVSYECFDLTLSRLWRHDEICEHQLVDGEYRSVGETAVLGVVTKGLDPSPQIACSCNNAFITLVAATGEVDRWVDAGAPLASASLVGEEGEFCVAGCTIEGDVFVRHPLTNTLQKDAMYRGSFSQSVNAGLPLTNKGEFTGFAAWNNDSHSYFIFKLDDMAGRGGQRNSNGVGTTCVSNGMNMAAVNVEGVGLLDPNSLDALWSVELSSLDLGDSEKVQLFLTPTSVIAYGVENTDEDTMTLKLAELSNKDGSVVVAWSLPWPKELDVRSGSLKIVDYNQGKDDRRLVVINDRSTFRVIDLDTKETVLEKGRGTSSAMFENVMLAQDSVIVLAEAGVFDRLEHISLESGNEIGGHLSQAGVENMLATSTMAFLDEKRTSIAIRCIDGVVRAYSTHDGSFLWSSNSTLKNIQFVCRANDEYLVVQDSTGCCYLLQSSDGKTVMASSMPLPAMQSCERPDDGSSTVVLRHKLKGSGSASSLMMLAWDDISFGPISEVNYGLFFARDGKSVMVDAPWSDSYIIYERIPCEEMLEIAKGLIESYDGTSSNDSSGS